MRSIRFAASVITLAILTACSSVSSIKVPFTNSNHDTYKAMDASYAGVTAQYTLANYVTAPRQCFDEEVQIGMPVSFHRESIIDQPRLLKRELQKVPSRPTADRGFYCAAFAYSVDEKGRVTDISTLYNSHPGLAGIDFAKDARKTLKQWQYQPGQVDKAPAKFTGLSTVFYYTFEG